MRAVDRRGPEPDRRIRVLIVEDQVIIAMGQAQTLRKSGYVVDTVSSGEDAVEFMLRNADVDVVLMDIDLGPGIDGTEATKRILEARDVPVVFVTSHSEKSMVDKAQGISRYGYVMKSSGAFVLVESIMTALKLHAERRAMQLLDRRYPRSRRDSETR